MKEILFALVISLTMNCSFAGTIQENYKEKQEELKTVLELVNITPNEHIQVLGVHLKEKPDPEHKISDADGQSIIHIELKVDREYYNQIFSNHNGMDINDAHKMFKDKIIKKYGFNIDELKVVHHMTGELFAETWVRSRSYYWFIDLSNSDGDVYMVCYTSTLSLMGEKLKHIATPILED